ncbi:hypothetical protein [Catonella massiliensis]|uniref:Uncharacterized protein n=1 Tax=Catonella massiliensis TaxID=2799636 RepID=A0ABS1J1A4_9FIRM|nr:hypothetical protein [Catonella massiliensis]MBK5897790.1 hypothetical protein [Catonella massiliensis]
MADQKTGNGVNSDDEAMMDYRLSDAEWQLILRKYEKCQSELSPLARSNISRLIHSIAASKTITTVQQVNLLITLLLYKEDVQEYEETEQTISHKNNTGIKAFDDDDKIMRINEIVEQLRLLIMQYQAHDKCKIMCHELVRNRR